MPWWGWIVLGAVLLASEMAVTTQFYLVLLGVAALVMGLLGMAGLEGPIWMQWIQFGALSVFFFVAFRRRVWRRVMERQDKLEENLIDEVAVTEEPIRPVGPAAPSFAAPSGQSETKGTRPSMRGSAPV